MRIALVCEHYPPEPGGVATSAQRVARGLVAQGAEVQIMCFDSSRPLECDDYIIEELDCGVRVARIGPFFLRHPALAELSISEKIRAAFRRRAFGQMIRLAEFFRPQAVLSFYLLNAGFLGRYLAAHCRIPCVVGVRGNDIGLNIFHVERFGVIQWVVTGAQAVACVNQHLYDRLTLAFPQVMSRAQVIPNTISPAPGIAPDLGARARLLQATGWGESDLIAVFIGTLREKKGVCALLKAIMSAKGRAPIRLLVIGPEIGRLERRLCGDLWDNLRSEGVVHVTGAINRHEVVQWALGGDLILMPSLEDGLANGLLEGMSIGLCPIASRIFADVIEHGRTGFLVDPLQDYELGSTLVRLAGERGELLAIGANARGHVLAEHNTEREISAYRDLLAKCIESWGIHNDSSL